MKSNKFVRGIFGLILSCFVIAGITSCTPPSGSQVAASDSGSSAGSQITYLDAVEGVPDSFLGTWEATNYAGDIYVIEKNKITATYMEMNVVASSIVNNEGYTFIFCQVPEGKGTQYTPAGNFYVAAVKINGSNIDFCYQLDYSSNYTSLNDLKEHYVQSCTVGSNYFATYSKKNLNNAASQAITLTDSTGYMTQVKFEKTKVTLLMTGASGWGEYTSFTPVRDTSKENSSISLYLYSSADRSLTGDMHYMKINSDGSIYWYEYDDDEGDNDTTIDFCNGSMPTVSSENLAAIKALYE